LPTSRRALPELEGHLSNLADFLNILFSPDSNRKKDSHLPTSKVIGFEIDLSRRALKNF
jgi:hypothetical protein